MDEWAVIFITCHSCNLKPSMIELSASGKCQRRVLAASASGEHDPTRYTPSFKVRHLYALVELNANL
jgi:hypothetical protein